MDALAVPVKNEAEKLDAPIVGPVDVVTQEPKYPLVSIPPESPSWTITTDDPFVLTPLNITVIRLTHDGMPVKSIEVPEVEATAVPETSGYKLVVTPLACTAPLNVPVVPVTGPEDSKSGVVIPFVPSRTIVMFFSDQITTQREPLETVTVTPEFIETGPVDIAFLLAGIV